MEARRRLLAGGAREAATLGPCVSSEVHRACHACVLGAVQRLYARPPPQLGHHPRAFMLVLSCTEVAMHKGLAEAAS